MHDPDIRSYKTLLTVCCGVSFLCYFGSYMRLPVVPLYAKSLGADTMQVGIINSAFFSMAALLSLPMGLVSDRLGRKLLASAGLLVLAGTSFLLYFSKSPAQLIWIYLLFGVALAAFGPTMMSFVADISPPTHLGRSYGWYTTALYGGMSVGPAVGGFVAGVSGFQKTFLFSGLFIFITLILMVLLLPKPQHVRASGRREGMRAVLRELLRNRPLIACWIATIGGCLGLGMFIAFLPLHAHNQGLDVGEIGIVFSVQGFANALSRIPFGNLSDRVTRRANLVIIGTVGFAASMAGFSLSSSLTSFVLSALILGCGMGMAFTSIGALIAETVPARSRGIAMGGYNTCIYFGMMLSSGGMGAVIQAVGFSSTFLLIAFINVLLIILFHFLIREFTVEGKSAMARESSSQHD